jgi:hypothetical protein
MLFIALRVYNAVRRFFHDLCSSNPYPVTVRRSILSECFTDDQLENLDRVPEDAVVVDEYLCEGVRKCLVYYEGEALRPPSYLYDPFNTCPVIPWIWIGDSSTDTDLTSALRKYVVPGNTIKLDLIYKIIQTTDKTNIVFIEPRTFKEVKFPEEGVSIHAE